MFHAQAGTTYYLQLLDGLSDTQFSLTVAPAAQASFSYLPSDPSILDTVHFNDVSNQIGGIGSRSWRLGDGFTSTDGFVEHQYRADGVYTATYDIVTTDGRTASTSQAVPVRTRDIAITAMTVPSTGRVGRTKQLSVWINNSHYPETVQASISRSVPGRWFEDVGQVTQRLPKRAANRSTKFEISCTFDEQDVVLGKVTFQFAADILGARDAHRADNTVIAPPDHDGRTLTRP